MGLFFFVWIALITLLCIETMKARHLKKHQALTGAIEKASYWYDIYAGQKKIGFANTTHEKVGDEIIIRDESEIKVKRWTG